MKEDVLNSFSPLQVNVRNNNIDEAIRRFKQMVQKDGVLNRFREHQVYEKPSVKRRRKNAESWHRKQLTEMREKLIASGEWDLRQKKKERKRLEKLEEKNKKQEASAEGIKAGS